MPFPRRMKLVALAALLLAAPAAAQAVERHALPGRDVAVYLLAGTVRVVPSSGGGAMVEVRALGEDAGRLRAWTGPVGGRPVLRVMFPGDRVVYPAAGGQAGVRMNPDGTFSPGGDEGRRVLVASDGRGLRAHAELRVHLPPGVRLHVHSGAGAVEVRGVRAPVAVTTSLSNVTAADVQGSLDVRTGAGDVRVERLAGDLRVETVLGRVDALQVRGARVEVVTSGGNVTASAVHAAELRLRSISGNIAAAAAGEPAVRVTTASGAVQLDLPAGVRSARVEAVGGSVRLRLARALDARVQVRAPAAGVRVTYPFARQSRGADGLVAVAGRGTRAIEVSTLSGTVSLDPLP